MLRLGVKLLLIVFFSIAACGCAGPKKHSKRPVQPISSLATRRAQQENAVARFGKAAGKGALNGGAWLVKELMLPFHALRKGMVNLFGVETEVIPADKNLPPSAYR